MWKFVYKKFTFSGRVKLEGGGDKELITKFSHFRLKMTNFSPTPKWNFYLSKLSLTLVIMGMTSSTPVLGRLVYFWQRAVKRKLICLQGTALLSDKHEMSRFALLRSNITQGTGKPWHILFYSTFTIRMTILTDIRDHLGLCWYFTDKDLGVKITFS